MDWVANIITVLVASAMSAAVALIALRVNTRTAKETTVANLTVAQQEAETHRFSAILDGYKNTVDEYKETVESLKADLGKAETGLKDMRARVERIELDNELLMEHIPILEAMIPTPPGPPARPKLRARLERN